MIHEKICTYEVCKLATEKGFDEYAEAFYAEDCNIPHIQGPEKWNEYKGRYAATTQSLLQRWLREEKGLHITVPFDPNEFWWQIKNLANGDVAYGEVLGFATYELALEDALKYALENLV